MVYFNLDPTILRSRTAKKLVSLLVRCAFHIGDDSNALKLKSDIMKIKAMSDEEINKPSSRKRSKTKNGS